MRIICIGNRFYYPDNFGMLIYDQLKKMKLNYEIIEGGIGGLNLIPYFEDDEKILIVDYSKNINKKILTKKDIERIELNEYNHATAFLYLLKSIEKDYYVYLGNGDFNPSNLDPFIKEILELAEKI